jgi:hypothetical protein
VLRRWFDQTFNLLLDWLLLKAIVRNNSELFDHLKLLWFQVGVGYAGLVAWQQHESVGLAFFLVKG